jgi:predicted permease
MAANDFVHAFRQLRNSPGFTVAAIATLALGLGANIAIYRVLDAVVFRSLPVHDPERLVLVQLMQNDKPYRFSYPLFREMSARQQPLEGMFAASQLPLRDAVLRGRGPLRAISGSIVTGGYFGVLGVPARAGRVFTDEDDRPAAPPVAVISYDFWRNEFDRSASALGQSLQINNLVVTIIGVTPPGFHGEIVGDAPDFWLPMSVQPQVMPSDWLNAPSSSWLAVMGRLRPGVAPRQAQIALDALYRQLADLAPRRVNATYRVQLEPGSRGVAELAERFGGPLWMLMAIVGMVLLMACCNLANLLLGRAAARTHEIGVRLAMGASRGRLVRQLLAESLVLSGLGALAGVALAAWGSRALVALASGGGRWRLPLETDWRVAAFTAAATLLAAFLFGLAPALAATRLDLRSALQSNRRGGASGRSGRLFAKGMIVAQVSLSLALVSGASLLVESLRNLRRQDFGFDGQHVLLIDLPLEFNKNVMARARALAQPLYTRLNQMPGVLSAAVSGFGPAAGLQHTGSFDSPEYKAQERDYGRIVNVSPRYFETMGTAMVAGRPLGDEDRAGAPRAAVISETTARTLFPGGNAVGRFIGSKGVFDVQVVGVARDVRFAGPRDPYRFVVYLPLAQDPTPVTGAVVRAAGDPAVLANAVRTAVHEIDPTVRIGRTVTLATAMDGYLDNEKTLALVSACFGALALILTSVGVYGVISYAVERRTREIGIRVALGATRRLVEATVLREAAALVAASLVLGGAGALAMESAMHKLLFGIAPGDLAALAPAAAMLVAVAFVAAYVPARRAARLDPMDALRQE